MSDSMNCDEGCMTKKRNDQRINYISKCLLEIRGTRYFGLLENISTTGASIEMLGISPSNIHRGDVCTLTTLLLSPVKYSCIILRADSTQIALQFVDSDSKQHF